MITIYDKENKKLIPIENCYLLDTTMLSLDDIINLEHGEIDKVSAKSQLSTADYLVVKSIIRSRLK
jgi:hypothetical protein